MTHHVLVPVDDSDHSREAFDYAVSQHAGDTITVLHVLDPGEITAYDGAGGIVMANFEEIQERRRGEGERLLDQMRERAGSHDVEIATELTTGRPAHTIVEYAEEHDVDHVVLGSRGRTGVSRVLLGSVAETVVRRSKVPVTVVR